MDTPADETDPDLIARARARGLALADAEDAQLRLSCIEAARVDINAFLEYVFTVSPGVPVQQALLHKRWHSHLDSYSFAGIIAPRGHAKSTQILYKVIFEIGKNPNIRIKFVCNDLIKAKKRLRFVRTEIEKNPRIHEVFPNLMPDATNADWNAASFTVKREQPLAEPTVEARGVLTAGTGGRADLLIFDDVCDLENAIKKPALRDKVISAYEEDWINLLEPTAKAIYIATPWHREDLTAKLLLSHDWKFIRFAINDDLDPIWPEMWTRERLRQRQNMIGRVAFERGFKCRIVADAEDAQFNEADLERSKDGELGVEDLKEVTEGWPLYMGVDLASGKKTKAAKYQVAFTIAVEPGTLVRIPVDIQRRREPMNRFFNRVAEFAHARRVEVITIENNAVQEAIISMGRAHELRGLPIRSYYTGRQKWDPEIGLPGLSAEFAADLWRLPYGPKGKATHPVACKCNYCAFINECRDGMLSQTTDIMMAAWLSTRPIKRRGNSLKSISASLRGASNAAWDIALGKDEPVARGRVASHDPGW